MYSKDRHCSYCGCAFPVAAGWPRQCLQCGHTSYRNPLPVAVLVLPVEQGVIGVRRGIAPRLGQIALPGGFIEVGESWQQAAVRELYEETGIRIAAEQVQLLALHSAPDGTLLAFGLAPHMALAELPPFVATAESAERVVITPGQTLAFPLHTQVLAQYWQPASMTMPATNPDATLGIHQD